MAEPIQHRPEQAKRFRPETQDELEKFEGRLAEINGLLDELYDSGIMRWVKDFVGALPEVSMIALSSLDTPHGRSGMRNLLVLAQQLGRIDPDQLERLCDAVHSATDRAEETASGNYDSEYNPPGITGAFKLMRDEELWRTLAPLIEGARAFSTENARQKNEAEQSDNADTSE